MRIIAALDGNLEAHMAAELDEAEKAVTGAVRQAGEGLKRDWRAQITAAGLGQRLARTIRNQHYPKAGASLSAAAMVWSKAPVIVGAHDAGALIRSKNGFWLAIRRPPPARRSVAGASLRGHGSKRPDCGCASSTGVACRRCSSPTGHASPGAGWRWQAGARPDAGRSPHRSSSWSRRCA